MSLVNDLLEDFYKRRVSPGDHSKSPLRGIKLAARQTAAQSGSRSAVKAIRGGHIIQSLLISLCVLLAVTLWISESRTPFYSPPKTPAVSAMPPPADWAAPGLDEPSNIPKAASFEAAVQEIPEDEFDLSTTFTAESELDEIAVERGADYTRLRFLIDGPTDYWIQGDPVEGKIEVVFSNAKLTHSLSAVALMGSGVWLLESHHSQLGLHLLLGFDSVARIQSHLLIDRGRSEVVLDITPIGEVAEATPTKPDTQSKTAWGEITRRTTRDRDRFESAEHALHSAQGYLDHEQIPEATGEFIRALNLDPRSHRAREALISILIESGQLDSAERHLERGLDISPRHSSYTLLQARVFIARQQPDRAIALLEDSPTPKARRSDALNLLAALYQGKGDHIKAERLFRSAVRITPGEGRLWMGLGISLEGQQRGGEALAVYRQATALDDLERGPKRWLESRIRLLAGVQ